MESIDTDKSGRIDYTGKKKKGFQKNFSIMKYTIHFQKLISKFASSSRIFGCYNGKKSLLKRRKAIYGL